MTEQEWLECADHKPMLALLQGVDHFEECINGTDLRPIFDRLFPSTFSPRKLRLFATACCRRAWHLLTDERSRTAVEVGERLADRKATDKERDEAIAAARQVCNSGRPPHYHAEYVATCAFHCAASDFSSYDSNYQVVQNLCWLADPGNWEAGLVQQTLIFRDIFGNPFRPVSVDSSWLTPEVVHPAQAIYDQRAFDRLPALAEALEQAGCAHAEILAHCRGPGPHVKGCWVVDAVLDKE